MQTKNNTITKDIAYNLMKETNGKIFNVKFIKKDGTFRNMTCRVGVSKHVTGKGLNYNPSERENLIVYDVEKALQLKKEGKNLKGAYRTVKLSTVFEVSTGGNVYEVE